MYECPLTLWNSANIDISEAQRRAVSTMTTKNSWREISLPLSLPFNIVASVNLVVKQLRIQTRWYKKCEGLIKAAAKKQDNMIMTTPS